MATIKTETELTYAPAGKKHSWTIRPDMGEVSHFPAEACEELVKLGAVYVDKSKTGKAAKT
ncbi:hypothetical protein [Thalassobius sp. I31.1]|uniref:hypothetical protein n=1 Tax=Thalassobius sp. I31.1 TaxID=2109912 RepID=UPI000D1998E0|nr:hypothetical protein [Thalassobius sp. I31.1]